MLLLTGEKRSCGAESSWLWQSPVTMMSVSRAMRYGMGFLNMTWSAGGAHRRTQVTTTPRQHQPHRYGPAVHPCPTPCCVQYMVG